MFCLCFAYVLLFDFVDFQMSVNGLVTDKVQFPPAPLKVLKNYLKN